MTSYQNKRALYKAQKTMGRAVWNLWNQRTGDTIGLVSKKSGWIEIKNGIRRAMVIELGITPRFITLKGETVNGFEVQCIVKKRIINLLMEPVHIY